MSLNLVSQRWPLSHFFGKHLFSISQLTLELGLPTMGSLFQVAELFADTKVQAMG